MSRKFTPVEQKWGGSWGLIGPVADFPDFGDIWEKLTKEAQVVVVKAAIKQRIEYSNFAIGQLKENVAMLQKVQEMM
jgi:hypothetical protein